ncbi:ATP-binding cassette domain-containing protein, partial [Alphaproteobacteria bacterium]|nr:ATP-binding cassette domain-containing protein [Alphaproteobacteria bacterium]
FDVIAGFHKPSSGNIMWGDKNLLVEPPWLRPISVMFQSDNFFPHLSIRKNLMLGVKNSKKLIERMHYYMNFLEVYDLLNRQPESLSGGELQRVSLIHALMREMPILMLDEPFSALDLDMVEKSSQLIKEDMQINKSIHLIISHQDITPFLAADQIIELS